MNRDLTTPIIKSRDVYTTGFSITKDESNYGGGWIKYSTNSLPTPVSRGEGNCGNIEVTTDDGLKVKEVKLELNGK